MRLIQTIIRWALAPYDYLKCAYDDLVMDRDLQRAAEERKREEGKRE